MLARKIALKHYFEGPPTLGDFELVEETLSDTLKDGGISLLSFTLDRINYNSFVVRCIILNK